jgi:hypothetical protein
MYLVADRSESVRSATLETLLLAATLNFKCPGAKGTWLSWLTLTYLVASHPTFSSGRVMRFGVLALRALQDILKTDRGVSATGN